MAVEIGRMENGDGNLPRFHPPSAGKDQTDKKDSDSLH